MVQTSCGNGVDRDDLSHIVPPVPILLGIHPWPVHDPGADDRRNKRAFSINSALERPLSLLVIEQRTSALECKRALDNKVMKVGL